MDDVIAQLQKLGELKEQGILTEEEFEAQKAKLPSAESRQAKLARSSPTTDPTLARASSELAYRPSMAATASSMVGHTRRSVSSCVASRSPTWPRSWAMTSCCPSRREVVGELVEHAHGGDVDERDGLGVEHDAADAGRGGVRPDRRADGVGVGEEQPGLDAQHGDARHRRRSRGGVEVAELVGGPGDLAELGDVRLRRPVQQAAAATRRCR